MTLTEAEEAGCGLLDLLHILLYNPNAKASPWSCVMQDPHQPRPSRQLRICCSQKSQWTERSLLPQSQHCLHSKLRCCFQPTVFQLGLIDKHFMLHSYHMGTVGQESQHPSAAAGSHHPPPRLWKQGLQWIYLALGCTSAISGLNQPLVCGLPVQPSLPFLICNVSIL